MTVRRRRSGIVLCGQIDGDVEGWRLQWERAPDAAGSPDTANAEIVDVLDAGEMQLVDTEPSMFATSAPSYWYRYRTIRGPCSTPGTFSDWIRATADFFPEELPVCPGAAAGPPRVDLEQTSATIIVETWQATATEHPESEAGASGLELRYRTRVEGKDWSDWQPSGGDGWSGTNPLPIPVIRDATRQTFVAVVARDTALAGSPESAVRTITIKSIQDQIDLPPLGRGPLEDDRSRGGVGGHTPGGDRILAPTRTRDGSEEMVDTSGRGYRHANVRSSVFLDAGVQQDDGARAGFLNKATEFTPLSEGFHGNGINFSENYAEKPAVIPLPGYLSSHANLGGTQFPDVRAVDVSTSGFTVQAQVKEPASGGSTVSAPFSGDSIGDVGTTTTDFSADMEDGSNDPADDDKYTFFGSMSVFCTTTEFGCTAGSQSIRIYTNDGSGWIYRTADSVSCECSSNSKAVEETISVSGLSPHAGKEFAVGEGTHTGGVYSMDRVEWTTEGTAGGSEDATRGGDNPVQFAVYAQTDG